MIRPQLVGVAVDHDTEGLALTVLSEVANREIAIRDHS